MHLKGRAVLVWIYQKKLQSFKEDGLDHVSRRLIFFFLLSLPPIQPERIQCTMVHLNQLCAPLVSG